VQQIVGRLTTEELVKFFEKAGPVRDAQIVKDRVSGRSKGYVFICYCIELLANICIVSVTSSLKARILSKLPSDSPDMCY
jgi:RNA-binding protein 39